MKTLFGLIFFISLSVFFCGCNKKAGSQIISNDDNTVGTLSSETSPFDTIGINPGDFPNIIFIFADDLGYGDIGCFGATDINTPNIDRIDAEGIKFTDFYCASSICSPSRAALLTGRYSQRMGVYSVFFPESETGMNPEEITIAELLKVRDYTTGIVGKWHLGHQPQFLPLQQGFDSYFGIPYSNDMSNLVYMRGNEIDETRVKQKYITKTYTEEALDFIEENKDKNFFLYVAHNMPHVPIFASEGFIGTSDRGLYGDVVQELDWSVGEIISKVEELGLVEKTLIIFSSDNGPWLVMGEDGGSPGILREGKNFTFEGGMRVPAVAMWKGKIPAGTIYHGMATQMDWLPTFANLAGISVPNDRLIDGFDITQVLFNQGIRKDSTLLYMDEITGELQCYRKGGWKIKEPYPGFAGTQWKSHVEPHDTLLIDLKVDPGETNNLYKTYPEKAIDLFKEMHQKYSALGDLPSPLVTR